MFPPQLRGFDPNKRENLFFFFPLGGIDDCSLFPLFSMTQPPSPSIVTFTLLGLLFPCIFFSPVTQIASSPALASGHASATLVAEAVASFFFFFFSLMFFPLFFFFFFFLRRSFSERFRVPPHPLLFRFFDRSCTIGVSFLCFTP